MLKFISLGSGSSGNCYYLNADGYGIVVDVGIGIRSFKRIFSNYGLSLSQIKAILVTHDHTDHVKAVAALSRELHIPVYTSQKVHDSMLSNHFLPKKVEPNECRAIEQNTMFELGPFKITSFFVPHDSADNNGYIIQVENKRFVILTDVGHFTEEMANIVGNATHLIIESNYDDKMLETGRYPQRLKKRIKGAYGHSSNIETATFLSHHLNKQLIQRVWLCHLSAENNLPRIAYETSAEALRKVGFELDGVHFKLEVLARKIPSLLMEL